MVKNLGKVSKSRHHYQDELEVFTWSALVAIGIALQDHKIHSKMSEHIFIMHWLAIAKKRKLFSRSVANELQWLIDEGKKKSINAQLKFKIEYLYATSSGDVTMQNDYFKFTHTIEMLRNNGWQNFLLTPEKWRDLHDKIKVRKGNFIFMDDTRLQECFGAQGEIVKPFCIRVYGDVEFAKLTFIKHHLPVEFVKDISNEFHHFQFLTDK
ncbi:MULTISPECIES: DUF2913 family protein [Citrobacter freundii complex]|uniref:DUF2913 family protein n=1 Tax=Citrobacter freundii complex TaxID=1344959 RepID=UPI0004562F70|nr:MULTISPECIES: DUF2913 family protein [Citrobacter]AHY12143.1 hypothetical protein CFNIH1_11665 [Citrobacter freundii CFNIH1]MBD0818467.1 DUF2913 family protein [Citrobacter sp. C5_2]KAA0558247.1 DUF2913 family protein [Citrobacter werkmanii]NSL36309.1 DUF2913 family protein [Citrobacter werkmanii]RYH98948.1 DUF2913 family protein [Citrobacter werkmanii]